MTINKYLWWPGRKVAYAYKAGSGWRIDQLGAYTLDCRGISTTGHVTYVVENSDRMVVLTPLFRLFISNEAKEVDLA